MAQEIIKARVWWKVATEAEWTDNPLILGAGEPAWVITEDGKGVNVKVGVGNKRFSDLNYFVSSGGEFISVTGKALPTPTIPSGYSVVGEGTYTHVNGNVVVPTGRIGVIVWDVNQWTLGNTNVVAAGRGITSISKTNTSGLVDTYTILYSDSTSSTYTVVNGRGISSISLTSTSGLIDTYTITFNDGTTQSYDVKNGQDGTNAIPFNVKGTLDLYSQIPPSGNVQNDAYYIKEDELIYVYNGSTFPAFGDGIKINSGLGDDVVDIAELPTFDGFDDQNFGHAGDQSLVWRAV